MADIELRENRKFAEPTEKKKRELYEFYELLFRSSFTEAKKRSVMTAILGYETWGWRVVGITEEAIKAIASNKFRKPSKKLARDHHRPRAETYKEIFSRKMEFEEWWDFVWENDKTTLMTNDEHHRKNAQPISKVYPVNPSDSYFVDAEVAGWHQTQKREGEFVRTLCEKHSIEH